MFASFVHSIRQYNVGSGHCSAFLENHTVSV